MKRYRDKVLFLLCCMMGISVYAADIVVSTASGLDAAIDQANATTAVDRIVLRIPSFTYGRVLVASRNITQPLIIDGSELVNYKKYFPVAQLLLLQRDTSKSLTLKGILYNTGYISSNDNKNVIRNNMTFVDCNIFNIGTYEDDMSVFIKKANKVNFKGCVFSYHLYKNKTFSRSYTHDRISIYSSNNIVFGGTGQNEANVVVGFWKKGIFLYKCKNVQFNANYIGVVPAALSTFPIQDQPTGVGHGYSKMNGMDGIFLAKCNQIVIGGSSINDATIIGNMYTNGIYLINSNNITIRNSKIGVHDNGRTRVANMNGIVTAGTYHKYSGGAPTELLSYNGGVQDTNPGFYSSRCNNIRILNNIISGNRVNGIQLGSTDSVVISGNKIGTDVTGVLNVGNGWDYDRLTNMGDGINLFDCSRIYIGADVVESGVNTSYVANYIGFNRHGISAKKTQRMKIERNMVGVNSYGNVAISNKVHGIAIWDSCRYVTIGPQAYDGNYASSRRNRIGGNTGDGIYIEGSSTELNWVSYNTFGEDGIANGANKGYGVRVNRSFNNLIGYDGSDEALTANIFTANMKGHIKLEYTRNNFIAMNIYKAPVTNAVDKPISLSLSTAAKSNYSSVAPIITSITKGSDGNTLVVKGTTVLSSEHVQLYSHSSTGGKEYLQRGVSSGGQWTMTLTSSQKGIASILGGSVEGTFVALASCSNNCQGAYNANASLRHNTSEFGAPFSIKFDTYDCEGCIESFAPSRTVRYVLGAWVSEDITGGNTVDTYEKAGIQIGFNGNTLQKKTYRAKGKIIDGWQHIEEEFEVPQEAGNITITLVNDGAANVYYDDIRIHPLEGEMKSFVYDPLTQKLVAELDENNYATFYEYDKEGILVRVKKETERGVYTIKESRTHQAEK